MRNLFGFLSCVVKDVRSKSNLSERSKIARRPTLFYAIRWINIHFDHFDSTSSSNKRNSQISCGFCLLIKIHLPNTVTFHQCHESDEQSAKYSWRILHMNYSVVNDRLKLHLAQLQNSKPIKKAITFRMAKYCMIIIDVLRSFHKAVKYTIWSEGIYQFLWSRWYYIYNSHDSSGKRSFLWIVQP